jgi:HAD superfamily hydrolase (TIGR01459 family)
LLALDFSKRFPVWLCDIWGVVHNGEAPIASAVQALQKHRARGSKVVLISNAPRPASSVLLHLNAMGIPKDISDAIVTSGDVTRNLMVQHGKAGLYHLGPEIDLPLFKGLDVARVDLAKAGAVVCTGLFDELNETAKDYLPLLAEMKQRNLQMICANPDKVVRKGDLLLPCAGALAFEYQAMGGEVLMAGKPFAPIYDVALQLAGNSDLSKVLAIGDGPETDVKGAALNGLACLFVTGGINTNPLIVDEVRLLYPDLEIVAAMPELYWG